MFEQSPSAFDQTIHRGQHAEAGHIVALTIAPITHQSMSATTTIKSTHIFILTPHRPSFMRATAVATAASTRKEIHRTVSVCPSFALVGPPGSGKGSYGRLLSQSFNIPLITVSTLLQQAGLDVGKGVLINDETVSEVLMDKLPSSTAFILDGYPRTVEQVNIMRAKWPSHRIVDTVVHLNVPRPVCRQKLLGRRACPVCHSNWNVADVRYGQYILPPHLPLPDGPSNQCCLDHHETGHWSKRADDDQESVVDRRLDTFYAATEPLLDLFRQDNAVFDFSPFRGFDDYTRMETQLTEWFEQRDMPVSGKHHSPMSGKSLPSSKL